MLSFLHLYLLFYYNLLTVLHLLMVKLPSCSAIAIAHKRDKIVAIWQHNKRVLGLFFTAHAQKRLFTSFRSKIWPNRSLWQPRFPIRQMYFHYRVTFTGYIRCFLCYYVAWPCDLVLWPFDLESVSCTVLSVSDPHTNFYYPMSIGDWVTSTEYLITFQLSETVTTHAPCHVTSNLGQK